MSKKCYVPVKGVDDVIAARLGLTFVSEATGQRVNDWYRVANLRAIYDDNHKVPLDVDNMSIDELTKKIAIQIRDLGKKNNAAINTAISNKEKSYRKLRKVFNVEQRKDRIRMIASYFTQIVNEYQEKYPGVPRKAIIDGFTNSKGMMIGGQAALFQDVYNRFMHQRARWYRGSINQSFDEDFRNTYEHRFNEMTKVLDLDIFSSLVAGARYALRDTEGLIMGQKYDYSSTASLENYDEGEVEKEWEAAESKREGWMEKTDETSAIGSVALEVRKFLSTVPQMEYYDNSNGNIEAREVRDDMGCVRYMETASAHSNLMEVLDSVQNEEHMMKLLTDDKGNAKMLWLIPVIEKLRSDHRLRTQFFVDFKKPFQPYASFFEDKKESKKRGARFYKRRILNRLQNLLGGEYAYRITFGDKLNDDSIFESSSMTERGNVNWENLAKLKEEVKKWVKETPTTNIFATSDARLLDKNVGKDEKVRFITYTFKALGINLSPETAEKIVTSNSIYKVRDILSDYFDLGSQATGISLIMDKLVSDNLSLWNSKQYSKMTSVTMLGFYNQKHKPEDKVAKIREHTEKLLNIVTKHQEGMRLEPRCRYQDKTLFSRVAPNFMSDRLGVIKSYVDANDKTGLKKYLLSEYCDNTFFVEKNLVGEMTHVYNYWLKSLLDCCDTPDSVRLEDTFAGNFTFDRDMGSNDQTFENFTSKTHALDMLITFFSDEEQNKRFVTEMTMINGKKQRIYRQSALYSTFILGDSGVSKYLRAPRILEDNGKWGNKSKEKLIDLMYDVYLQERKRMNLIKQVNEKLRSEGYAGIRDSDKFSTLVFLNEDKYSLPDNATESEVKKMIWTYMNDGTAKFIEDLRKLGVLDMQRIRDKDGNLKETGRLEHLNQIGKPDEINNRLEDFFWNNKFAMIQQLQIMTVDPSFYKDTKDLQKRYKEIHAPGSALSLYARNPFKEGNPYFNNVTVRNGELVSDPETALYINDIELSVEDTDSDFAQAIKNNRKTAKYIKDYRESSLTDGQGWRTLTSYRKVMGMAGKWTQEMENVYDEIMDLRARFNKRVPGKNDPDFKDYMDRIASIAKKAVVFQPIKPYMFTHEKYAVNSVDKILIPVQHKYSEAVLIPELLPEGSQLRDMAYWMDEHKEYTKDSEGNIIDAKDSPIDLICATTVVKVGGFGASEVKGIKGRDAFYEALSKGYVHKLDYKDYRIQQPVPEHMNGSQLFGTQIRKLIMSHLRLGGTYNYLKNLKASPKTINLGGRRGMVNAQDLNGRNLLALYNSLIVANIMDSYDDFAREVGDIDKISDILMQSTLNNSRESMDNLLSYAVTGNADFLMPLFEGGLEHDTAALMLSIFKKKVNKQTIQGGSAVQASAFGIHGYEEDGGLRYVTDPKNPDNILYAECEMPFRLSFYDVRTKSEVRLDFDTYCNVDGTLKGEVIKEGHPEYDEWQSYEDKDGNRIKPKIEVDYPGILSLVAYRIPTERDYSMINLKVKRFSRPTAGGTMKVPVQGTKISGFDFDIDKLYYIRKEFRKHTVKSQYDESNFSKEDRYEIFANVYENYPSIYNALLEYRDRKDPSSTVPLHTFWKDADIERRFGYTKTELFEESAVELGIDPEKEVEDAGKEYFEEYDFEKTPEKNTRVARNNLLVELIKARLSDPETFAERYTPGGFANPKKAARKIRELMFGSLDGVNSSNALEVAEKRISNKEKDPEPNYDPTEPMTIVIYNQQNQVAGKLIGIFANQNTNHAFASLMHSFEVNNSFIIEFAGHSYKTDGVGKDLIHPPHRADGMNDVDLHVAELLASSVDAVKDPVLNFLNLNQVTADSGATLIRLGYSHEEVGLLFNQPVIRELCEKCSNESLNVDQAIRSLKDELNVDTSKLSLNISKDALVAGIINDRKYREKGNVNYVRENAEESAIVIALFDRIHQVANDVGSFINNTKFTASNAVSSTFGGMYAQQMRINDYVSKFQPDKDGFISNGTIKMKIVEGNPTIREMKSPIDNNPDLIKMSIDEYMEYVRMNPFAFEQAMYDANRKAIALLAPERGKAIYPYGRSMYVELREFLRSVSDYNLDDKTIDSFHRDIMVYHLANQTASEFCGERQSKYADMSNREYYTKQFVNDLLKVLKDRKDLMRLPIFGYMKPEEVTDNDGNVTGYQLIVQDIGGLHSSTAEEIKESWASLMETDDMGRPTDPIAYELGTNLFMYCFYKLGYDFSPVTFMDLAPTEVKERINVQRMRSLPINTFNDTKQNSNEVYVFYPGNNEQNETAWNEYGYSETVKEGLVGNSYVLPWFDSNDDFNPDSFRKLCYTAMSNPDLVFHIQPVLEQYEIDAIRDARIDIPSNVRFNNESVLGKEWSGVSYGKVRSYREFLSDVLSGKDSSVDREECVKQFILNNLDNYRFVLSIYGGEIKQFLDDTKVRASSFGEASDYVDIDLSTATTDVRNQFVRLTVDPSTNEIISAKWKPVIKIGDYYFMADGDMRFDMNQSLKMRYNHVEPMGIKNKSKMYKSDMVEYVNTDNDDEEVPIPQQPVNDRPDPQPQGPSRETLEKVIKINIMRALSVDFFEDDGGVLSDESKNKAYEDFRKGQKIDSKTDEELKAFVDELRREARENGITFYDENGFAEESC